MKAYVTKLGIRWVSFMQAPNGIWIELGGYHHTKEAGVAYLKECGFEVVEDRSI